jgi:hypothetical protein
MATSTLIQKLDGTALISNISGSPGSYTSVSTPDVSNRSQVETFVVKRATGSTAGTVTIVKGDWVAFDTSQSGAERVLCVDQAEIVAAGNALVLGVALDSVTVTVPTATGAVNQALCRVVVGGYVEVANVLATTALGVTLSACITTAGRAAATVAGSLNSCGVTLAIADASNVAPCWVYKQF